MPFVFIPGFGNSSGLNQLRKVGANILESKILSQLNHCEKQGWTSEIASSIYISLLQDIRSTERSFLLWSTRDVWHWIMDLLHTYHLHCHGIGAQQSNHVFYLIFGHRLQHTQLFAKRMCSISAWKTCLFPHLWCGGWASK